MGCSSRSNVHGLLIILSFSSFACGGATGDPPTRGTSNVTVTGGGTETGGAVVDSGGAVTAMPTGGVDNASGGTGGDAVPACTTAGCPAVNECASADLNNCGSATCMDLEQGFECVCDGGLTFKDGECICDLVGTYAVRTVAPLSWQESKFALNVVIAAGTLDSVGYGLLTITRDGTALTAHSKGCGSDSPDLCSPYYKEAFRQTFLDTMWDYEKMPVTDIPLTFTSEAPSGTFSTPPTASFLGLRLASGVDPLGAFPSTATDPLIVWVDDDGDGQLGVTSYVTAPGGNSTTCSYPYAYFPVDAVTGDRAQSFYAGARTVSRLEGTITDCNTLTGQVFTDSVHGRVYGCVLDNGSPCSASQSDFVDSNSGGQSIGTASFVMVKVAATASQCADVRSASFPN